MHYKGSKYKCKEINEYHRFIALGLKFGCFVLFCFSYVRSRGTLFLKIVRKKKRRGRVLRRRGGCKWNSFKISFPRSNFYVKKNIKSLDEIAHWNWQYVSLLSILVPLCSPLFLLSTKDMVDVLNILNDLSPHQSFSDENTNQTSIYN